MLKFTLFSISKFVPHEFKPFVGGLTNGCQYYLILRGCVKTI
jgi:hypothetical protein